LQGDLVSFDVVSLFASILSDLAIETIKQHLVECDNFDKTPNWVVENIYGGLKLA